MLIWVVSKSCSLFVVVIDRWGLIDVVLGFWQYFIPTWSVWMLVVIGLIWCFSTRARWWKPPKNRTSICPSVFSWEPTTLAGQYGKPFCLAYTISWKGRQGLANQCLSPLEWILNYNLDKKVENIFSCLSDNSLWYVSTTYPVHTIISLHFDAIFSSVGILMLCINILPHKPLPPLNYISIKSLWSCFTC